MVMPINGQFSALNINSSKVLKYWWDDKIYNLNICVHEMCMKRFNGPFKTINCN